MMLDIPSLAVIVLATLFLSFALTRTKGVFNSFAYIREHYPLGGLTTCLPCAAFWISLAFYALWQVGAQPVVYVFAAAGGAVALAQYVGMSQQ